MIEIIEKDLISDIDINQAAREYDRINTIWGAKVVFVDAVTWYRNYLTIKLKQNEQPN